MERYLVETRHSKEKCKLMINQIYTMGYLNNFEWGCEDGIHCGWAIIEAESEKQAMLVVPTIARPDTRIVRVVKFDLDQSREFHAD